jgi:hypothetical protein
MQADSHSTGRDHLCAIVVYPRWLRVRVGRILAGEVFCSGVRGRRCFDLDFCGFIHRACSLALPAMPQTICQVQRLLAPKLFALRSEVLEVTCVSGPRVGAKYDEVHHCGRQHGGRRKYPENGTRRTSGRECDHNDNVHDRWIFD